jgi:hypothetical protein
MNKAEGAGSVNELDELGVTCPQPLLPVVSDTAERKVRGEPEGLRFKTGAEEEEKGEMVEGRDHLAVNGLAGGKGGRW